MHILIRTLAGLGVRSRCVPKDARLGVRVWEGFDWGWIALPGMASRGLRFEVFRYLPHPVALVLYLFCAFFLHFLQPLVQLLVLLVGGLEQREKEEE